MALTQVGLCDVCRCPLMIWIWLCYCFRASNKWMALTCPDRFELADIPSREGRLVRRPRHRSLPEACRLGRTSCSWKGQTAQSAVARPSQLLSRSWRSTHFIKLPRVLPRRRPSSDTQSPESHSLIPVLARVRHRRYWRSTRAVAVELHRLAAENTEQRRPVARVRFSFLVAACPPQEGSP